MARHKKKADRKENDLLLSVNFIKLPPEKD
jgi:hypothetical protein